MSERNWMIPHERLIIRVSFMLMRKKSLEGGPQSKDRTGAGRRDHVIGIELMDTRSNTNCQA